MNCISCGAEHSSKYCPECGEKGNVVPITFGSILGSVLSTISNMDRGFLYNVKHLTLRPQRFIDEYLNGRRKGIFNPISFLIIVVTLYLIWDATHRQPERNISNDPSLEEATEIGLRTAMFILTYFKYFWMLSVVWIGLATKLLFGRLNLAEHFVIAAFIMGYATLAVLLVSFFKPMAILYNPVTYLVMMVMLFRVFKRENVSVVVGLLKTVLVMLLFGIQLFATIIALVIPVNGLDTVMDMIVE